MVLETLHGLHATGITMHQRIAVYNAEHERKMKKSRVMRALMEPVIDVDAEPDIYPDFDEPDTDTVTRQIMDRHHEQLEQKKRALVIARRRALALARSLAAAKVAATATSQTLRQAAYKLGMKNRMKFWQRYYGYNRPQKGRWHYRGSQDVRYRGRGRGDGRWQYRGHNQNRGYTQHRGYTQNRGYTQHWQNTWQQRLKGPHFRGRGRGGMRRAPLLTKQELDAQLDEYMRKSRTCLDRELGECMYI